MSIKCKMVSFTTAAVLTLTLAGNSFAAAVPFTDLANVSAKDKIMALQEKGYINGDGRGLFAPDTVITAAEGIQLLVNAFGLNLDTVRFIKEPKATDYFPNAKNDAWYSSTLIVAAVNGVELPSGLDAEQQWTREEFTYYLNQAMQKYGKLPMIKIIPVEIADEDQITVDYQGAIQRALVYNVIKLDGEGKLNPKGKITRAEAAEQIYNALEYLKAHPAPVPETEEAPAE